MTSASDDHNADRSWIFPTLLLCAFGFFTHVKPSEPFLTPYLMGPVHNLTEEEVVNRIYPVWTYAYLALLIPIFLLTDYLKYKPVVILQSIGMIACWLLLLFGRGVPQMQLMQVFYAVSTSAGIGYFTYIYSVVHESHFQRVTSYVRSTTLAGSFVASLLSQLLVSLAHVDYFTLNIISLVNVSIAFLLSWLLPMPNTTFYFSSKSKSYCDDSKTDVEIESKSIGQQNDVKKHAANHTFISLNNSLIRLWTDTKECYSNVVLLRWSLWWALSTCGWFLVVNYTQNLWETIRSSSDSEIYNGAVESVATILGALGAFGVGYLKVRWNKWGELTLSVFSLAKCGLLMAMYWTTNIWVSYTAYVIFICAYSITITITQFQIALGLTTQRYALVFGINSFMAVALNTILTVTLVDKAGLGLNVNTQFIIYSGYFGLVSLIFLSHAVYSICCQRQNVAEEVTQAE